MFGLLLRDVILDFEVANGSTIVRAPTKEKMPNLFQWQFTFTRFLRVTADCVMHGTPFTNDRQDNQDINN